MALPEPGKDPESKPRLILGGAAILLLILALAPGAARAQVARSTATLPMRVDGLRLRPP